MDISHDYSRDQMVQILFALIERESKLDTIMRDAGRGTDAWADARRQRDIVSGLFNHFADRLHESL